MSTLSGAETGPAPRWLKVGSEAARIAITVFEAQAPIQGSVVIAGAVGVNQRYYRAFAQWLSQQGYRVITWDYRGQGASLDGRMRDVQADLYAWARDYDAVIVQAKALAPHCPLFLIGHSMGAQLPGLLQQHDLVDGLLSIAAGSGYWRANAKPLRYYVPVLWHVIVPCMTPLFGYFPGRRLGMVGDLPEGVIRQWRRWCLHPQYSVGAEGSTVALRYAAVRFPIRAWSFADDEMMTLAGTQQLMDLYSQAKVTIDALNTRVSHGVRMGHFGFFRVAQQQQFWPEVVSVLEGWRQHLTPAQAPVALAMRDAPVCQ